MKDYNSWNELLSDLGDPRLVAIANKARRIEGFGRLAWWAGVAFEVACVFVIAYTAMYFLTG